MSELNFIVKLNNTTKKLSVHDYKKHARDLNATGRIKLVRIKSVASSNDVTSQPSQIDYDDEKVTPSYSLETFNSINVVASIKTFDLSQDLDPKVTYDAINCRKSIEMFVITTLCVHDLDKDHLISNEIWEFGVWEADVLGL
jgi:hypothetical protein